MRWPKISLSSDVSREDAGRLAGRKGPATLQTGLLGYGRITAIIILGAFKGIGFSSRARFWRGPASMILGLVFLACVFASYSGKASAESYDASSTGFGLNRHLEVWANYQQPEHHRTTSHKVKKVKKYVRHHPQHHPHTRSEEPHYVAGPPVISRNALSGGPGRYHWKRDIVTTIFWVGERPGGHNPVPNLRSSWDRFWSYNYGGYDNPDAGARRNFIPVKFVPRQNPFYFALPYNDVEGGHTKREASRVIPWFNQAFVRNGQTVLKDRWIAVHRGNRVCYAQWEDCGPFRTDDWRYVFGDERPRPNLNQGAGLDVSPAVRDYLGLGVKDACDWKFVEFREVTPGPWATYGDNNTFVIQRRQSNERFAGR
ncbi:MAG TPA: hypothetical protein VK673_12455 [Chthoniobacterales bacterium]|nr:hypothetical protein [Chthoniobacterales bacterium]